MLGSDHFDEIRKYPSPHSILVIGPRGLRRISTPFIVTCRCDIKDSRKGMNILVSRVLLGTEGQLLFEVMGCAYPHSYFDIS